MGLKTYFSKLHYDKKPTVKRRLILLPLRFFAIFYTGAVLIKNLLHDKKILKSKKAEAYVISVGNLTTGGTGKTPICAEIANHFGNKCAIVSRGYKSRLSKKHPNLISNGEKIFHNARQAGDEPYWLAKNTNAYVITSTNRHKGAKFAIKNFNTTHIILDDGFQHRKLKRDLDILVIDSKMRFSNGFTLPAGALREPVSSIKRAHKIVLVSKNDPQAESYLQQLKEKFKKPVILCNLIPDKIYDIKTREPITLEDKKILAFSAIAQPEQFYAFLPQENLITKTFDDHHKYSKPDLKQLEIYAEQNGANILVTTEKDAVKIKNLPHKMPICALKLKADLNIEELLNC